MGKLSIRNVVILTFVILILSCRNNSKKDICDDFDKTNMFIEHSTEFSDLSLIFSMMTSSMSADSIKALINREFNYNNKNFIIVNQNKSNFHFIIYSNTDSLLYELKDSTINIYHMESSTKLVAPTTQ